MSDPAREARPLALELLHGQVRERLSDFLEGHLSRYDEQVVSTHLNHCDDCRRFRNTLKKTVRLLNSLDQNPAPSPLKRRLLDLADTRVSRR